MLLSEAEKLAKNLIEDFGLTDWYFKFDTAVRRFGLCSYKRKTISLSRKLTQLNDIKYVNDVLLHEIAHALVGSGKGHSHIWKHKAAEIGCSGTRCYSNSVITPPAKYKATCKKCGHKYTGNKIRICSCGVCNKKYDPTNLLEWVKN